MGAVFLGTPAAAIPSLAALADIADVDLVLTQPPRGRGRGRTAQQSPVSIAAGQFGFDVQMPEDREELFTALDVGFEFGLVVAYGAILTPAMIATTGLGFLNVHFSLLPRWRGAAPVERAIAAGDEHTGVTLMRIDEGLDTGPVLGEIATPIGPKETGGSLTARLSFLGASLVDSTIPEYLAGRRRPVPQIAAGTSHAEKLSRSEARLDPAWSAGRAERSVRAYTPRPGAWFATPSGALRIHRARPATHQSAQGEIVRVGSQVLAGFSDGAIELLTVQPEGGSAQSAVDWMNGRRGEPTSFDGNG